MKRQLAFLLAFCLIFTLMPVPALAAETVASGTCGENLTWELTEDGTLTISGTGNMHDYDVDNPAPWYEYSPLIVGVIIEDGVTSIGDHAFYMCSRMTGITLSDGLISIGDRAFSSCESLTSITLPDGITSIGDRAFSYCSSLTSITLPDGITSIGEWAFCYCVSLTGITLPDSITSIGERAFYSCGLTGITIPDGVTSIGEGMFAQSSFTSITLPESITSIGDYAFDGCQSLTGITIPDAVTSIGEGAFCACYGLTGITIPEGVISIGDYAFLYCNGLKTIYFVGDAPSIGTNTFTAVTATAYYPADNATWTEDVMQNYGGTVTWVPYGDPAEEEPVASGICGANLTWELTEDGTLTISGVGEMYDYRVSPAPWADYRYEIISLIVGEGVTNIGESAFDRTPNMTRVSLPASLRFIDNYAFYNCQKLESINLPDGLESIGQLAFQSCALKSVVIPASVTFLDTGVFTDSTALTDVLFLSDPNLPSFAMGSALFADCTALEEIRVEEGHIALRSIDGVLYYCRDNGEMRLNDYPAGKQDIRFRIADNTVSINQKAFRSQPWLEEVTVPATVNTIGDSAFTFSTVHTIRIEGSMPQLGDKAFRNLNLTISYPCGDSSWDNREAWNNQSYLGNNGSITWQIVHGYESTVTDPTCTEQGYTTYTCPGCGDSYTEAYTDPVDHRYEDGSCIWCGAEETLVQWYSGTTSLNGTIDLNIYVLLSDNLVNADDTYVRFTYAEKTVDVPMADALHSPNEGNPNRYRFSCPIYAKQLADSVNVKFMKGEEMLGEELNYSVKQYCENQIRKSPDEKLVALCKALLNYGTAAQELLNYNTENLANASLSEEDKILRDVDASDYKYSVTGSENGITARSATLMLEDVVKVRVYFTLTGDKPIEDYIFTIDGKAVTPSHNEKGWYVETDGIAGKDLEKMFKIQVGGITVNYGALSFVNSKVGGTNVLESNVSKALYAYWQAAEALLG